MFKHGACPVSFGCISPAQGWSQRGLLKSLSSPTIKFGFQAIRDALFIVHETKDLNAWGGVGFVIWDTSYFKNFKAR